MLSTIHDDSMVNRTDRRHRNQRHTKPTCISDYNKYMSGVDRTDQLLKPYEVPRNSLKWYKKVAIHFTQLSMLNNFINYQKDGDRKAFLGFQRKSLQLFCLKMEMVLTLTSPERRTLWGLLGVTLSSQFLKPARNENRDLFSYPQCSWQWLQNERWGIESLETSTDDNRQCQLRCAGWEMQPSFNSLGSLAVRFFGLVEASGEAVRNRLPGWPAFLLLPPLRILTIRRQVLWFVIRKCSYQNKSIPCSVRSFAAKGKVRQLCCCPLKIKFGDSKHFHAKPYQRLQVWRISKLHLQKSETDLEIEWSDTSSDRVSHACAQKIRLHKKSHRLEPAERAASSGRSFWWFKRTQTSFANDRFVVRSKSSNKERT